MQLFISSFKSEASRLLAKYARSISLAEEEDCKNLDDNVGDCYGPKSPAPGDILRYETSG